MLRLIIVRFSNWRKLMKTAEQMRIKTRKGIERITKRTFKKINNEIKEAAQRL